MMYDTDNPRPQDQADDSVMRDLYQYLGQHDLPGDPAFDTEAGLRDLISRMRRELPHHTADRGRELVSALAGTAAGPAETEHAQLEISRLEHAQQLEAARLDRAREDRRAAARTGTLFFAAITAMAAATIVLITVQHQTVPAAIVALTSINAITATAGTLIHRAGVPGRPTTGPGNPDPGADVPPLPAAASGSDPAPAPIHIKHLHGALTIAGTGTPPSKKGARPRRATVQVLIALALVAALIAIAIAIALGKIPGYEIPTVLAAPAVLAAIAWRLPGGRPLTRGKKRKPRPRPPASAAPRRRT
jgi:hypothetical protein